MRMKPWMLAPQSEAKAGPWSTLPPPVLMALASVEQSPMVKGYLVNRSWPGAAGNKPAALVASKPQDKAKANPQPKLPAELAPTDEASSLSLAIRVMQSKDEGNKPIELPPKSSTWQRFLQAVQRRVA